MRKLSERMVKMIGQYTVQQWILYFYVYCFLGWIFESCYVSLRKRQWVNRGFLHGPFLPIYGSGAVMMLFVSEPFKDNLILTYFAGVVGATLLELVTGAVMEALLKVRYWDYSNQKFNYKGYICLSSSVAWGFLTILMNEVFHPAILHLLAIVPKMADEIFVWIVSAGLAADLCISVRDAIDLRNILVGMENLRKEVVILRKRADVVIAVLDKEWREYVKSHPAVERMDEIGKEIELRLGKMKEMAELPKLPERQKLEMLEVKERVGKLKESCFHLKRKGAGPVRMLIKGNPTMASPKYAEAFNQLKGYLKDVEEKRKGEK